MDFGNKGKVKYFYAQQQQLLQCILAIAILSLCLSITCVDQSKMTSASKDHQIFTAWKTLVSGTIELFHKCEGVTPNEGAK